MSFPLLSWRRGQPPSAHNLLSGSYHTCKKSLHYHVDGIECLESYGKIKGMRLVESPGMTSVPCASSPSPSRRAWVEQAALAIPGCKLPPSPAGLMFQINITHRGNGVKYFRSAPKSFKEHREGIIWLW